MPRSSGYDKDATYRWLLAASLTMSLCALLIVIGGAMTHQARARSLAPAAATRPMTTFEMVEDTPTPPATPPVAQRTPTPRTPTPRTPTPRAPELPIAREPAPSEEPPPLAQAATVIAAEDTLDFTGETLVTGNAATYAGGVTHRDGNRATAVHGATHIAPGNDNDASASRARAPQLDATTLECAGLTFADAGDMESELLVLRLRVDRDGNVIDVRAVQRSESPIADDVIDCARDWHFDPALDVAGEPIAALSPPLRVRFKP